MVCTLDELREKVMRTLEKHNMSCVEFLSGNDFHNSFCEKTIAEQQNNDK